MTTMDIFEFLYPKFVINKPIRLIETFAGIGAQAKALENLGIDFEHWKVIEFDKYPVASYNAIHGTNFKPTDIRDVHAADLDMREREILLYPDIFISVPSPFGRGAHAWNVERKRKTKWTSVGS